MLAVSQGKLLQHLYQVPVSTDFLMFPISILRFLFFGDTPRIFPLAACVLDSFKLQAPRTLGALFSY